MALNTTWRGASGQSYIFEAYPVGTQFNAVSGVYIFCRQLASGNWEALSANAQGVVGRAF